MILDLAVVFALASSAGLPQGPKQEDVDRAIDRGVEALLGIQEPDGFWPYKRGGQRSDCSALALYTLLSCGVDPADDSVTRALAKLNDIGPTGTYGVACALLAITAHDRYEHLDWVQELADRLVSWQHDNGWGYPSGSDLSNTQFAAFGLRAASLYGAKVPTVVWHRLGESVRRYRRGKGFAYNRSAPTGAMTCAGVGTLAICEEMLRRAGALTERQAKMFREGREAGLEWLAARFVADTNPEGGGWPFYYLYGLERMGALTGVTYIDGRDWYAEGARFLLGVQREAGNWGHNSQSAQSIPETCFALLFLRRATRASITGKYMAAKHPHFETAPTPDAEVRLTASVGEPWTIWITGYPEALVRELEWPGERGRGLRVSRVVYLVDGRRVAEIVGDPTTPTEHERFPLRYEFRREGAHEIAVIVNVKRPPADGGLQTLRSPPLKVEVEGLTPAFWREGLADQGKNLLPDARPKVRASSAHDDRRRPENAIDGRARTAWLAKEDDEEPSLSIRLGRPVEARVVSLAHARTKPHRSGYFARAMEVEIEINGRDRHVVRMPYDERRAARLVLAEPVRVHDLSFTVLLKVPGEKPLVGLSEVRLLP